MKATQVRAVEEVGPQLKCVICLKDMKYVYGYVGKLQAVCSRKCSAIWDNMEAQQKSQLKEL